MNEKLYLDFIRNTIKAEGIQIADKANKIALEQHKIGTDLYLKAAQIIVKAYLAN